MMQEEPLIKLKSQSASATVNFIRGLIDTEEGEEVDEEEIEKAKQMLSLYTD